MSVFIKSHMMQYVAVSIFEHKNYFIYSLVNWKYFVNIHVFFTVIWCFNCSCAINSWHVGHFFLRLPFSTRALTTVDPKKQTNKTKPDRHLNYTNSSFANKRVKPQKNQKTIKTTKVQELLFSPKSSLIFFALLFCPGGGKTRLTTIWSIW